MSQKTTILAVPAVLALLALAPACVPAFDDKGDTGAERKDSGVLDAAHADSGIDEVDTGVDAPDAAAPDARAPDAMPSRPDTGPVSDMDNDGIPDNEDPAPAAANTRLFDDTFDTTSMGWTFTSVSMGIDADAGLLRVGVLEPFVREGWIGPRSQWFDFYARTLVRVTAVGQSPEEGSGRIGIIARVNTVSPDRYLFCAIDLDQSTVVLTEHDGGGPAGNVLATMPISLNLNQWTVLAIEVRGAGITCSAAGVDAVGSSTVHTTGSIGFRAFDATFEADLLEVYDL